MLQAGDVVIVDFPGVRETKKRPAIVISTDVYHTHRPDVIIGLLTTQMPSALSPTDYLLLDWTAAGLRHPSLFRSFLATVPAADAIQIGRLRDHDWQEVQARLKLAVAVP